MKIIYGLSFLIFISLDLISQREFLINGVVLESDSQTVIPFVYVINTKTGNGSLSDFNGRFTVRGSNKDTLIFSYVGFLKKKVLLGLVPSINDSTKQFVKIIMRKTVYELGAVTIQSFQIKPYERDYMNRVINRPKATGIDAFSSPITALYDQFSRRGRENRKLAEIFERIFIEEQIAQKFNPEILRKLTGDENIDFEKFRRFCYTCPDEFILRNDGYELYDAIMQCYNRWLREKY